MCELFRKCWEPLRHWNLERRRRDALSSIHEELSGFEGMVRRAEISGSDIGGASIEVDGIRRRLADIEDKVAQARSKQECDDLAEEAQKLAQLRAYICPVAEVATETECSLALMGEWGVPEDIIAGLRKMISPQLVDSSPATRRGALRAVFEEFDSWSSYVTDYNDSMNLTTYILTASIFILWLIAASLLTFAPRAAVFGLLAAGAAGGCVSVISKLPPLSLSREFHVYRRRIFGRIGTGIAASLIGCALLAWGVIPLSFNNVSFSQVLNACWGTNASCTLADVLVLLGVPTLLGFSERTLTSMEERFFGSKG